MNIRHLLGRQVYRRIEDWVKGEKVLTRLHFLEQAQWWPREKLEAYRLDRLQKLITHAYSNVPFYRERFDSAGLKPSDIQSIDDLARLPILSRDDLRQNAESKLRSSVHNFAHCFRSSSSGSTGDPVFFYKNGDVVSNGWATALAGWGMAGQMLGDKTILVWGNYKTVHYEWTTLGSRAKAWLYGETRIPACELTTTEAMEQALQVILNSNARFMHGYTNAVYALALEARLKGFKRKKPFEGILTTAETLSPAARLVIEEVFGPLCDGYGCGEVTGVAYQCQQRNGYHVMEPDVIVEYEDIGLGEEKALVLTDLNNYVMPLIRYRVGDIGVLGSDHCACGRTWRKLDSIRGRTNDILTTARGGHLLIPSVFGSTLLKDVLGIAQYQLAMVADDRVEIRVVPTSQFDVSNVGVIQKSLQPYLDGVINYSVEIVERIPPTPNGKLKLVVDERKYGL